LAPLIRARGVRPVHHQRGNQPAFTTTTKQSRQGQKPALAFKLRLPPNSSISTTTALYRLKIYPKVSTMADETPQDVKVDETPISPTLERRNSLEKHLQLRPDEQDLKNRNILLDTNAAP
jgi:hypothetical protein